MSAHLRTPPFPCLKIVLAAFLLAGVVGMGWLAGGLPAADPPGAKADGPGKDPKKRTEEEEDTPPKDPRVKRVEEEDPRAKPPQVRPADVPEIDLRLAARQARHPAVRKLFRKLEEPHDVVSFKGFSGVKERGGERDENVKPIPEYIPDVRDFKGPLTLTRLDKDWQPVPKPLTPSLSSIRSIQPYERLVLDEVKDFHGKQFEGLTRHEQLVAAEQALAWAVRFHESAKKRDERKGEGWEPLEKELRKFLLEVRLAQLYELKELKESTDLEQAIALTRRLAALYTSEEDQAQIARPLADLLKRALASSTARDDVQLSMARRQLRRLYEQFPNNKVIADSLRDHAEALFKAALALGPAEEVAKDPDKLRRARELLDRAEMTWPQLPDLRAYRNKLALTHPVLRVGVRELPKYLSPARACTDTELRAVELLFESLVKLDHDETGVLHYRPGLAVGRPGVVALGRQFTLPREALWSNNEQLTANDVRFTVRYLKGEPGQGSNRPEPRPGPWAGLLEEATMGKDPYRVTLSLRQGCLDPLEAMTFKLLPSSLPMPVDGEEFGQKPVGSGPFVYIGQQEDDQKRKYAGFTANPNYASRPSKIGLPRIQEVRFFATANPVKDLLDNRIDLALDLTAEQAQELKKEPDVRLSLSQQPVPNRRVYFLAVNTRRPALKNVDLRRALALAIDREKLLDEHFRGSLGQGVHRALNGPYPAHSWACNPRVKERLFDERLAKARAEEARKKLTALTALSLKYPEGDPALDKAMEALRDQVRQVAGIELQLEKCNLRKLLKEDLEDLQSFDLAYTYYDYPSEAYSLWPLLRSGKDDSNVFGFTDPNAMAILQDQRGHRHFADVQRCAQQLHELLNQEMPLIPLWQLDPVLAWHRCVKPVGLDPLLVFPDVDRWKLEPRQ
jgi:ABC-type oligopeptide transport system substrate-binding subunit